MREENALSSSAVGLVHMLHLSGAEGLLLALDPAPNVLLLRVG